MDPNTQVMLTCRVGYEDEELEKAGDQDAEIIFPPQQGEDIGVSGEFSLITADQLLEKQKQEIQEKLLDDERIKLELENEILLK